METFRKNFEDTLIDVCDYKNACNMRDDDFERMKRRVTDNKRYDIRQYKNKERQIPNIPIPVEIDKRDCHQSHMKTLPYDNEAHVSTPHSTINKKDKIKIKIKRDHHRNRVDDRDSNDSFDICCPTDKVIDVSEPKANPAFNLPNSGDKRPNDSVVDPGWHPIHRAIKKTTNPSNMTILTNNERRPFGSGVIRSVYIIDRRNYWEYVSKGFTECEFVKETDNPDLNGYGFEVVIRVAKNAKCHSEESTSSEQSCDNGNTDTIKHEWPDWPNELLASLLSLHTNCNIEIKPGDILDLYPGIAPNVPTAMSIAFTRDPCWSEKIETPFGSVCIYQAVLLSRGEGDIAASLGANRFTRSLYFDNVPYFDIFRKDSSEHALWSRFKDDVEIDPVKIDSLVLTTKGVDVKVSVSDEPVRIFKLLLSLVHGMQVKWVNPRTNIEITWIKFCSEESQDCDSSDLKHVIYVTPNGMKKLFRLFDDKATMWSEEVRDTPPWPLLIENTPCVELDITI